MAEQTDVEKLREHLMIYYGTDWGASDDHLRAVATREQERVRVTGRRWSWTVLAGEALKREAGGADG